MKNSRNTAIALGRCGHNGLRDLRVDVKSYVNGAGTGMEIGVQAFAIVDPRHGADADNEIAFSDQRLAVNGAIELAELPRDGVYHETLFVRLQQLPDYVQRVVITACILDRCRGRFNLGQASFLVEVANGRRQILVDEAYDPDPAKTDKSAIIFGEIYRHDGRWMFLRVERTLRGGLKSLCRTFKLS